MTLKTHLQSSVHDYCAHKTGYMFVVPDTLHLDAHDSEIGDPGGWTWHRTLRGAQAMRDRLGRGGDIFRILGDDHTERVHGV